MNARAPVLVVEDDPDLREAVSLTLRLERVNHTACESAEEALALAQAGVPFEVIPGVTTAVAGMVAPWKCGAATRASTRCTPPHPGRH